MSTLNKVAVKTREENAVKYLRIIQEKEQTIQRLLNEIETLKPRLELEQSQSSRIKKLERANEQLKQMLKESQGFILQQQPQLLNQIELTEKMEQIFKPYKIQKKDYLKFIEESIMNQSIIEQFMDLTEFLQILGPNIIISKSHDATKLLKHLGKKIHHPLSVKALLDHLMLQLVDLLPNKYQYKNIGMQLVQFKKQIQEEQQDCRTIEITIFNEEELIVQNKDLQSKLKLIQDQLIDSQNSTVQLKQQIESFQTQIKELQSQLKIAQSNHKEEERMPFIQVQSSNITPSSSDQSESGSDKAELQGLQMILEAKESYIKQEEAFKQSLLEQIRMFTNDGESFWNLQIQCNQSDVWKFKFSSEAGLNQYSQLVSVFSLSSQLIQSFIEQQMFDVPQFKKFENHSYSMLLNPEMIYLKSQKSNLFLFKVLQFQQQQTFHQISLDNDVHQCVDELWINFSQGPIYFIADQFNDLELQTIQKLQSYKKELIVITSNVSQFEYPFEIQKFSKRIDEIEQDEDAELHDFIGELTEFIVNRGTEYFEEQPEIDIQAKLNLMYEMKINQQFIYERPTQYTAQIPIVSLEIDNHQIMISIQLEIPCINVDIKYTHTANGTILQIITQLQDYTNKAFQANLPLIQMSNPQVDEMDKLVLISASF